MNSLKTVKLREKRCKQRFLKYIKDAIHFKNFYIFTSTPRPTKTLNVKLIREDELT